MNKPEKTRKGYNEKNPVQPEGSMVPDKNAGNQSLPEDASPNEKLSLPERKLRKEKK